MANAIPLWTKTYWSVSSLTISCWPHMESIGSTIPLCLDCVWKLPGTQTASVTRPSAPRRRGPRGARGASDARSVVFIELYEGYTMRYVISTRMRSDVEHIEWLSSMSAGLVLHKSAPSGESWMASESVSAHSVLDVFESCSVSVCPIVIGNLTEK